MSNSADAGKAARRASVDPAEVARFDRMAEDWWSDTGPMKALHRMNPVRVRWLRDHMADHFPAPDGGFREVEMPGVLDGLRILDIGCGGGILCEPLKRLGAEVTGLEPAAQNLAIARAHAAEMALDIDYRSDTAEELAATGAQFDVVCAMEVVEHVRNVRAFVRTACSMVRPGGLFFCATLNRTMKSFALAIVGAEYVLRWVPRGTHDWEKFVTPRELEAAIAAGGLDVHDSSGVVYNPLSRNWSTARDMDVNYMLVAGRE